MIHTELSDTGVAENAIEAPAFGAARRISAGRQRWRQWLDLFDHATAGERLGERGFWLFQLLFTGLSTVSLVILLKTYYNLDELPLIVAGRILTGLVLATVLHRVYMHRRMRRMRGWLKFSWILALNAVAALVSSSAWVGLISMGWPEIPADSQFSSLIVARGFALLTWNTAYFGVLLFMEYHAARLDVSEAKLAARAGELHQLRSQINPHFLLNSLNSVLAEKDDPAKVEALILSLAGYLRFSLKQGPGLAPLGVELAALEDYLKVEKIRFEEKLEYEVAADAVARSQEVPNALVLPLLENAIKYGQLTSSWPLRVGISAFIEAGCLVIEVANSGRWVEPGVSGGSGIGLFNLRRRLDLLYAGKAELREEIADSQVRVRAVLPVGFQPLVA